MQFIFALKKRSNHFVWFDLFLIVKMDVFGSFVYSDFDFDVPYGFDLFSKMWQTFRIYKKKMENSLNHSTKRYFKNIQ